MHLIQYGMEGYEVRLLQYALTRAGLEAGNLDGIFGRRTLRALQQFQRQEGLFADGVAGKLTWAALYPYLTGYTLHTTENEIRIVPLDLPAVTDLLPGSYLLTGLMMKGLAMRCRQLRIYEIGRSVMGRPIFAASMGEGPKQVGCIGPHGADGWSKTLSLLRILEDYIESYRAEESRAVELYEGVTLHLLPLVNPDGVDLVNGALDPRDSFYAQAKALSAHYPNIPFPDGWVSNISGMDLRYQYPIGWAANRNTLFRQGYTRPGPQGYAGGEPLTAPECRALARWTHRERFSCALCFDPGYADWFKTAFDHPSHVLREDVGDDLMDMIRSL